MKKVAMFEANEFSNIIDDINEFLGKIWVRDPVLHYSTVLLTVSDTDGPVIRYSVLIEYFKPGEL